MAGPTFLRVISCQGVSWLSRGLQAMWCPQALPLGPGGCGLPALDCIWTAGRVLCRTQQGVLGALLLGPDLGDSQPEGWSFLMVK